MDQATLHKGLEYQAPHGAQVGDFVLEIKSIIFEMRWPVLLFSRLD